MGDTNASRPRGSFGIGAEGVSKSANTGALVGPADRVGASLRLSSAAGGVEVDVNFTLVLMQLGVVTVLMLVLKPVLFEPLLALFAARESRIEGARPPARNWHHPAAEIIDILTKPLMQL